MTTKSPEVVGFATHHDEPMLFPSKADAAAYCETEEEPIDLIHLSGYEAIQAELKKAVAALTGARFTRCDGPAGWRPPLGNPVGTLIDRIDSLEAECEKLRSIISDLQEAIEASKRCPTV